MENIRGFYHFFLASLHLSSTELFALRLRHTKLMVAALHDVKFHLQHDKACTTRLFSIFSWDFNFFFIALSKFTLEDFFNAEIMLLIEPQSVSKKEENQDSVLIRDQLITQNHQLKLTLSPKNLKQAASKTNTKPGKKCFSFIFIYLYIMM